MATIINTLEVVLEAPAAAKQPAPATPPKAPPAPLTPRDLEDILERQMRAVVRLAAH
jgi:hypothetical protein